jgi:hypothetical protein
MYIIRWDLWDLSFHVLYLILMILRCVPRGASLTGAFWDGAGPTRSGAAGSGLGAVRPCDALAPAASQCRYPSHNPSQAGCSGRPIRTEPCMSLAPLLHVLARRACSSLCRLLFTSRLLFSVSPSLHVAPALLCAAFSSRRACSSLCRLLFTSRLLFSVSPSLHVAPALLCAAFSSRCACSSLCPAPVRAVHRHFQ